MNHHDERALAERRVVDLHASLGDGIAVCHTVEDVALAGEHAVCRARRQRERQTKR